MSAHAPRILATALVCLMALSSTGEAQAASEDPVPVLTLLAVPFRPEGTITPEEADEQRDAIRESAQDLRTDLSGTGYEDFERYGTIPYVSMEVNRDDLDELAESPEVAAIQEDVALRPALAETTPQIEAPAAWAMGATGSGQTVAVVDTGVDAGHSFLAGKVVEEACYSWGKDCPNGKAQQTGDGAGRPCAYATECNHGTHLAGIVAGSGPSFSGVAPGANLMAVQVFSEASGYSACGHAGSCALARTSDIISALERVYSLRARYSFAAVNLSVGWGSFAGPCDTDPMKPMIDNLRAVGIATVVASGNGGTPEAMSSPACISSAVSVGATMDGDPEEVAAYSSSSSGLSLLAPGSAVTSAVPGGGYATWDGTSMAAPHVAGAWAVLKGANPTVTVSTVLTNLQATGKPITDARNGRTTGRIRVFAALTAQGWAPHSAASPVRHGRHVTLRLSGHLVARGKVKVPDDYPVCLSDRVTIERKAGKWNKVRATTARRSGRYRVHIPDRPGRYRALLSTTVDCQADLSPSRKNR
ncbi:MAG: S8 family peptidase [Actinomycetota bacterium]